MAKQQLAVILDLIQSNLLPLWVGVHAVKGQQLLQKLVCVPAADCEWVIQ